MTTIAQALRDAVERLTEQRDTARLDAEVLLMHVLDKPRSHLYAWPERRLSPAELSRFETLLARRVAGEPVAHLTGQREFWSLPLGVTADTLIPRPETEILVEQTLAVLPPNEPLRIADLGTGSGAIALAIARERPRCEVHATDVSRAALAVAEANGQALAPGLVRFHLGSWLGALDGTFRVIVSNPPYIAENDPHATRGDCRFEPSGALVSGPDGLEAICEIASGAMTFLDPGGMIALEHGFDQGTRVRDLLETLGYRQVKTEFDLEGQERVTMGSRP